MSYKKKHSVWNQLSEGYTMIMSYYERDILPSLKGGGLLFNLINI